MTTPEEPIESESESVEEEYRPPCRRRLIFELDEEVP